MSRRIKFFMIIDQSKFPDLCQIECTSSGSSGNVIFASTCGGSVATVIITFDGKIKSPTYSENIQLLTCWANHNYAAVSYIRMNRKQKVSLISIFQILNNSIRSYYTQFPLIASDGKYLIFDNDYIAQVSPSIFILQSSDASGPSFLSSILGSAGTGSIEGVNLKVTRSVGLFPCTLR